MLAMLATLAMPAMLAMLAMLTMLAMLAMPAILAMLAMLAMLAVALLDSDPGFLKVSSGSLGAWCCLTSLVRIMNFPGMLFFSSFIILEFLTVFKL